MEQQVHPKKALGQHFLKDSNIARKIAESLSLDQGCKIVLEIGPGTGMLTNFLIPNNDYKWYGIELDREAVAYLQKCHPNMKSHILHGDFLKYDLKSLIGDEQLAIIGNFPYNISTQIMFRALNMRTQVVELVGMFQKEVARRIASPPGSKDYGILSVLTQAFYDVKVLFHVDPHVFAPPPNVQSSVLRCVRKETFKLDCDEKKLFIVVKTAFNQRRKTLRNSLKSLNVNWEALPPGFSGKRPEQLHYYDFVHIVNHLTQSKQGVS